MARWSARHVLGRWSLVVGVLVGGALLTGPVVADPTPAELNKARAQFQQGLALETAGDWAGALALLQEVGAVKMTPQVRFNIALCEEHLGRLAVALGDYKLALAEAEASKIAVVAEQAPGKIDGLNARVPKVTVRRGTGADFASITLDGIALGAASIGTEMPVDPGPHTLEARAPGFNLFINSFHIGEREKKTVDVTLAKAAAPAQHLASEDRPVAPPPVADKPTAPESGASQHTVWPYVAWGVGGASLAVAGVFYFFVRAPAISDLDKACGADRNHCPPGWDGTYDKASTATTISEICLAAGVVAAGTGLVLYLTEKPSATAPKVDAVLGAPGAAAGMSLRGSF